MEHLSSNISNNVQIIGTNKISSSFFVQSFNDKASKIQTLTTFKFIAKHGLRVLQFV